MIYLKPMGGLCNRMRSIDSLLSICKKSQIDLTVLWVKDFSLNCSFNDLFETPTFKEFNLRILDCPEGYPEQFLDSSASVNLSKDGIVTVENMTIRKIKHLLKGNFLNAEQRTILKKIKGLAKECIITNDFLTDIYILEDITVKEMDANFIPKAEAIYRPMLTHENTIYISSCYRIYPLENAYTAFTPILNIRNKIEAVTASFQDVIGLHIRRSDHQTSKAISTTERFAEIVETELTNNPKSRFFISTDDKITKKELIDRHGDKVLSNMVSSYDRNNDEAIIDAVVDLFCLSRTKKIYGSHHSTFSQTASDLGGIEEITVR